MAIKIYSYNNGQGSKLLADALDCYLIKHQGSRYRPRRGDIVVNWGSSNLPSTFAPARVLNAPEKVKRAVNKLSFFQHLDNRDGVRLPLWTREKNVAKIWSDQGKTVVCRTKLSSSEGDGIVIAKTVAELVDAPLYTLYVPKKHEYRIHVFNGQAIDQTKKVLKNEYRGRNDINWAVRNTANGFVFQRNGIVVPESVTQMAIQCVAACELDFGAADVIVSSNGDAYILEVNTAPGIEGSTVQKYKEAIENYARNHR